MNMMDVYRFVYRNCKVGNVLFLDFDAMLNVIGIGKYGLIFEQDTFRMVVSLQLNPSGISTVYYGYANKNKLAFNRVLQRYHKEDGYAAIREVPELARLTGATAPGIVNNFLANQVKIHGNVKKPMMNSKVPEGVKVPLQYLLLNNMKLTPKYAMNFLTLSDNPGAPNIICFLDLGELQVFALKCMLVKKTRAGLEVLELGHGTFSEGQLKECLRQERVRYKLNKDSGLKRFIADRVANPNILSQRDASIRYIKLRNQYFDAADYTIKDKDDKRKVNRQREQMVFSLLEKCIHQLAHRCTKALIDYNSNVQLEEGTVNNAASSGNSNESMKGLSKVFVVLGADFVSKDHVHRSHANGLKHFNFAYKKLADFLTNSSLITCLKLNEAFTSQTCPKYVLLLQLCVGSCHSINLLCFE